MNKINVVIVGLKFGSSFVDLYKRHPKVGTVGIYDIDVESTNICQKFFNVDKVYGSFEEILNDPNVDAVHLVTPIPLHAQQTVQVLNANKHCACTVPMATSIDDIKLIGEAVKRTNKNYMMMETTLYTYHFLYIQEMLEKNEFGRIQFLRGTHYQDMTNWSDYWMGLPPMYYGTHAIAPMVVLSGSRIKRVNCFGSGTMDVELQKKYNNPYPVECALFEFENGLKGEATRTLFETARIYQEGLFVYGSKASFEWGFSDGDLPYITKSEPQSANIRGTKDTVEQVIPPKYLEKIPVEIIPKTNSLGVKGIEDENGHHGSHPHLVHEFIMSIIENRKPFIDYYLAANITAAGICAHESAMKNGETIIIPNFE